MELGFARVYFLPPGRLDTWCARAKESGFGAELPYDIAAAYPRAGCVALCIYPYLPYADGERIPAYYINSNRAYRAAKALVTQLNAEGIRCEYAFFPYRALAYACGVGDIGKNGLLHLTPYGSRIVLQALAIEGLAPLAYDETERCCPPGCDACARACPSGAISDKGLDVARCIRAQMEGALRSDGVKRLLSCHVGCERCMLACPFNAALPENEPDAQAREAFELRRLILGDASAARKLVGRNMTSSGKLIAEAIVFAARQGLYEDEIRAALSSPFEAVRDAAAWALDNNFQNQL
ncbi:MAG: 4Fe-4S double cluster binding domain-containing protein [Clostridiaceae bacterium]